MLAGILGEILRQVKATRVTWLAILFTEHSCLLVGGGGLLAAHLPITTAPENNLMLDYMLCEVAQLSVLFCVWLKLPQ